MSANDQTIKKVMPRHVEIMRRLCFGESQRDIANDLCLTEGRLSIIVNSPLFQLELRKMQRRQEDKIAAIHEKIIEGAEKSIDLHNEIVSGSITVKNGDEEFIVSVPLSSRQQSATAISNLFLRLTRGSALDPSDPSNESYEERLEKEVTFKETTIIKKSMSKEDSAKLEEMMDSETDDALDIIVDQSVGVTA